MPPGPRGGAAQRAGGAAGSRRRRGWRGGRGPRVETRGRGVFFGNQVGKVQGGWEFVVK